MNDLTLTLVGSDAQDRFAVETRVADVPGGKLYITTAHAGENSEAISVAQAFVPNPPPQFTVQVTDEDLRALAECRDVARARSLFRGILKAHGLDIVA
ncbi:hypothetical protein HOT99_gp178 [Caulobacter phage CcrBL10]|uniref:Uncharacterized protein n=1 Tax=Caulobacter phage CcrBL10 TaxID=2283269 RepID=A0A385ECL4_9CAUD|nr:hypothetical protein HOT99_gp178 [Caulobacter phage CcrBL10]AXQ68439.1 hypothetical protein CcrBL10_gp235 [Caulobacter phage CcrBL10]